MDSLADADAVAADLAAAGFPRRPDVVADEPKPGDPDPARWAKRYHASADPGRLVHLHVRVHGSPGWVYALRMRDWLRADPSARAEYLAVKREAAAESAADPDAAGYVARKEPWFDAADERAAKWAVSAGWSTR